MKHADEEVQTLAQRIVCTWKRQLAEHRQQVKTVASSSTGRR